MAVSDYDRLAEGLAKEIFRTLFHPDENGDTIETKWLEWDRERQQATRAARRAVAYIAEHLGHSLTDAGQSDGER